MHYFWSFSRTKTGAGLLKKCVFVLTLHAVCSASVQTSSINPPSSALPSSSHVSPLSTGVFFTSSHRDRGRKKPFSHCAGGLVLSSALYRKKKKQSLFFSVYPYHNLLAKMFFLFFWQTRCVSLCVNVYILLYICERTKWALLFVCLFVFACWCVLSACYFTCERFAVC